VVSRLERALPAVAILSALALAADLVLIGLWGEPDPDVPSPNRAAVEETLNELQAMRPASLDAAAFRQAVEALLERRGVETVWLLSPAGRVVLSAGSTAASTPPDATVEALATDDARLLLDALPPDAISAEQRTWLLTAAAIRREGGHNDIYRHLVRPIRAPDGSVVALVGIAYDFGGTVPGPRWILAVVAALTCLMVYWVSLPLWVLLDARRRGEPAVAWATFVLVGNLVALVAYILVHAPRPDSTSSV
jgi:hypothetical protein